MNLLVIIILLFQICFAEFTCKQELTDILVGAAQEDTIQLRRYYYTGKVLNDIGYMRSCNRLDKSYYSLVDYKYDYTQITWSLCTPKQCKITDIEDIIKNADDIFQYLFVEKLGMGLLKDVNLTNVRIITPEQDQKDDYYMKGPLYIISCCLVCLYSLLVLISTIYYFFNHRSFYFNPDLQNQDVETYKTKTIKRTESQQIANNLAQELQQPLSSFYSAFQSETNEQENEIQLKSKEKILDSNSNSQNKSASRTNGNAQVGFRKAQLLTSLSLTYG